jgi:hypothetical protein
MINVEERGHVTTIAMMGEMVKNNIHKFLKN